MNALHRSARWLVVPLAAAATACSPGPGVTVQRFMRATADGNVTEAMGLMSSRFVGTLGEQKTRAILARATDQMRERGGLRSVDIRRETEHDGTAEVAARSAFGNGVATVDTLQLVREDRQWKLNPKMSK